MLGPALIKCAARIPSLRYASAITGTVVVSEFRDTAQVELEKDTEFMCEATMVEGGALPEFGTCVTRVPLRYTWCVCLYTLAASSSLACHGIR